MLIDSHCHLDYEPAHNLPKVIARAKQAGIITMQTIATSKKNISSVIEIIEQYDCVYGSAGVHPSEVGKDEPISYEEIFSYAQHPKIIGIGETGLDYHVDRADPAKQKQSFLTHITAAANTSLPIIIHSRSADADMIEIIESEMSNQHFTGLLHCFTSLPELAQKAINCGLYISFSGIITFQKTDYLQDILKQIPLDKILIETDSPYLSPEPYRGKKNEPARLIHTAQHIAKILGITYQEVAALTTDNFYTLFKKCPKKLIPNN